jgi:hypothetical protein
MIDMKKSTKKIVLKYGPKRCVEALMLHETKGMDGQSIGHYLQVHTNTADAMINAGQEIREEQQLIQE